MTPTSGRGSKELLSRRSIYKHWMQERVRWSDTDQIGHVNNLAYAAYCETGRSHFVHSFPADPAEGRALQVVAQLTINFLAETHWPALIDVGTGVLSVGRTSYRVVQALFDGERIVATSEAVLVIIDKNTRKPRRIPDWLLPHLNDHLIPAESASVKT